MAYANGPKIVTDGLVCCLDAANRKSYAGSGSTWKDLSGNSNDVTLYNGPAFSNDAGGCLIFDGIDDIIVGPSSLSGFVNSAMSIEIWTKPDDISQRTTLLSKWGRSSLGNFSWLLFLNWWTVGNIYFLVGNSSGNNYSQHYISHNLSISNYSHFAVTYDAGQVKMYRNGSLIGTSMSSYTSLKSVSTYLGIGHDYDTGVGDNVYRFYDGKIPRISINNVCLSDDRILQNYNATKGRFGL